MTEILAVLTVLGFIGSAPQFWGSNWKSIWIYNKNGLLSWEMVHTSAKNIISSLHKEHFEPDVIVGIGRGGVITAGLLASELTKNQLISQVQNEKNPYPSTHIRIEIINSKIFLKKQELYQNADENNVSSKVDKIELNNADIHVNQQEKILIVVAQSFTGNTLAHALEIMDKNGIPRDNIKTASLFCHQYQHVRPSHVPDISGKNIGINKTLPWKNKNINTDRY